MREQKNNSFVRDQYVDFYNLTYSKSIQNTFIQDIIKYLLTVLIKTQGALSPGDAFNINISQQLI